MSNSNRSSFQLDTDLISLRSFIAVVEEGGFSAAAKRVNRSQSAISLQVAKLEERLNSKLLNRTSRVMTLTSAGEKFIDYARRIIELSDEAILAVSATDTPTVLRVGFAEYLVPQHLHNLLARFRRVHPKCDLSIVLGSGSSILQSLERGELDVVLAGPEGKNGHVLWQEALVWTGFLNIENNHDEPLELVLMHAPCSYRQIAFDALATNKMSWKVSIDANSVHAVQSAIYAGLGLSVLPRSAVLDGMPVISEGMPSLPKTSVSSYIPDNANHPLAERFIEYLKSGLAQSADLEIHEQQIPA
ncbi:LysR family transcriptional regulator [Agarilytica rhodophyticola]|uniref:LysR family transcriptional regulator n=1 Tax=Agarilytica rhodophyticola TaxID=1737490 RepID=UPI000B349C2B|nr:LysR family transcriptional regulator [Agarilytica rhodophyticola]